MAYGTIVVGTDGSVTANIARDVALRLAGRFGGRLVLVTAFEPPRISRPMAESVVKRAVDAGRRLDVEVVPELVTGDPAERILDAAGRHDADLIVVGNKGMGQATRFKLGSVPDRIAHIAPCDVLIVDTTRSKRPRSARMFKTILAGTDGSPTAGEAARSAMELAMMMRAVVTLLYVGDPIVGAIKLEDAAKSRPEGVRVETVVAQGDPAQQLIELAEGGDVDLIVVGNKGMAGARRFLLGSVPNTVAHHAPTDVLIVKTVDRRLEDVPPGRGALVDVAGRKVAVFRDEDGAVHALAPKCTHMGCTVGWNGTEGTWDCPCHGSRFAVDGSVIRGPATKPLARDDADSGGAPRAGNAEPDRSEGGGAVRAGTGPRGPRSGPRFVVVGASLAGGTAAATLRRRGFDGPLTLIGAEERLPYERPPLSKGLLRGESSFEDALVEPAAFWRDQDVDVRLGTVVESVDTASKAVIVAGGERVPYDALLLATGARNRRLPIPGLDLPGVHDLRTVDDAEGIRTEMRTGRHAVVAGMGFIGSEVAASLRSRGLDVTVVDGNAAPLQRVLGEQVGGVLEAIHRDHGVRMIFRDRVAAFEGGDRVERVVTAEGHRIDCDVVVVGLGVEPVVDVVRSSPVEVDNGILVDELCRTSAEGVFAAGDVANHRHPVLGRRLRVEHWQNAIKHGTAAALSMLGAGRPYADIHWFWSDQYDQNLQYAGYHTEWDDLIIRGRLEERDFSAYYMKEGRVQAVVALNRGQDVERGKQLIATRSPVDPQALGDERVDVATLV